MTPTEQLAEALRRIVADVDAPGHTVRNVTAQSIAQARAALAAWDATNQPREPQPLGRAPGATL